MDFDDFERIYSLGLDEVLIGEREPDSEEKMLLSAIAAEPGNSEEGPSILMRIWAFLIGA